MKRKMSHRGEGEGGQKGVQKVTRIIWMAPYKKWYLMLFCIWRISTRLFNYIFLEKIIQIWNGSTYLWYFWFREREVLEVTETKLHARLHQRVDRHHRLERDRICLQMLNIKIFSLVTVMRYFKSNFNGIEQSWVYEVTTTHSCFAVSKIKKCIIIYN